MKKKNKWLALAAACAAAGALAWLLRSPGGEKVQYVFNYAENQTADYPTTLGAYKFAELVEERTNGRIQILVQPEAELGAEKDVLQQMQYGGIDFARISLSQLAERIPEMNVLQLPYLYRDAEHMWSVLDGEIGGSFLEKPADGGLVGLSWYDAGVRSFYSSKKKITCLEDLRGMRVRVQESEMMAQMVEALGAVAVQMAYSEVYSALELGNVDAAENNWPSYETMKHYEVAKYYTEDEHARVPEMQIISGHTWEKLNEEDRRIIQECARESALYERGLWTEWEKEAREAAVRAGVQIIELTEDEKKRFREAVGSVYETYAGDCMEIVEAIQAL